MVDESVVEPDANAMRKLFTSAEFALRQRVVLGTPGPPLESCSGEDGVELGSRAPRRIEVKVTAACRGM